MTERKVWATSEDGKINYISLTSDRLEEAILELKESFFMHENVCVSVGIPKHPEALCDLDEIIMHAAMDGVSLVAVDNDTGKIVGVLLNKIQGKNTSSNDYYEKYIKATNCPEIKEIMKFLAKMEDSYDFFTEYNADCLMELLFLGVSPKYAKRGIGHKLMEVSLELAALLCKGENVKTSIDGSKLPLEPVPTIVTSLLTSFKTQRIGQRLNFDVVKKISCEEFYYEGKSYASVIGHETKEFILVCKKLA